MARGPCLHGTRMEHRSLPALLRTSCIAACIILGVTRTAVGQSSAGVLSPLHQFAGPDGSYPIAGLVQGIDGRFYGTTASGGDAGVGTVFSIDGRDGSGFAVLHQFTGGADGGSPYAALIQTSDGYFYGTTTCGGGVTSCLDWTNFGSGTIFKVDASGHFTTVYTFSVKGDPDGAWPYAGLVEGRDHKLYGTTWCGGIGTDCSNADISLEGMGTIFKFDPVSNAFTVLYTFTGPDGCSPAAALIEDRAVDGLFYGTTAYCGVAAGTLFKFDAAHSSRVGSFTLLHAFTNDIDGGSPTAQLVTGTDGDLYGVTRFGGFVGGSGNGTVFRVNANTGVLTTLHTFVTGVDGGLPFGGLVQAADGLFYGTTYWGATPPLTGTLFRVDPAGVFWTLYMFKGDVDGQQPLAPLARGTVAGDARLYGVTTAGPGDAGPGGVFRLTPPPSLACPASVVVSATSLTGAVVPLTVKVTDLAQSPTTVTWNLDGSTAQTDALAASPSTATVSLSAPLSVGTHTVTIVATDALQLSVSCSFSVRVDKKPQTIAFGAVPTQTAGNPPVALVATATSGLPVTFSVESGPGTIAGNVLTITGSGSILVKASQSGNGMYDAAADVAQTIAVRKLGATKISVACGTFVYDGAKHPATASAIGLDGTPTGPLQITYASGGLVSAAAPVPAGSYAVTATFAGDAVSPPASAACVLTIGRAALTVAANNATKVQGTPNPVFAANYVGFAGSDGASALLGALTFATTATTHSPSGTYAIVPAGVTSPNYTITFVRGTLTVVPKHSGRGNSANHNDEADDDDQGR